MQCSTVHNLQFTLQYSTKVKCSRCWRPAVYDIMVSGPSSHYLCPCTHMARSLGTYGQTWQTWPALEERIGSHGTHGQLWRSTGADKAYMASSEGTHGQAWKTWPALEERIGRHGTHGQLWRNTLADMAYMANSGETHALYCTAFHLPPLLPL